MAPFSAFRFPSHDIREVMGLQNLIRAFRASIARGDEVSEEMIQDFCACLKAREFYDFAKAHFPLIRNRLDDTIIEHNPTMSRILEAAAPHIPAAYLPPVADTVPGLLAQKYALLMFDIVERGALGGRKIGPAMRRALCAGLKEVFKILGLTVSGNLAKYGDGAETDRHGLSEQAGKTRTHPKAGPQPAEVQTQTGLYNGGNTCYQNSGFQMVLSSSAAREALSQALQSGNLGGTEICKILSDMFQSVIAEDFGESKTQLRLFWAELREQGSMFKPGRQQDAEEFLTSCLGPEFADVLTTAWGYRSVQVWRCTNCSHSESKAGGSGLVYRLPMKSAADTTLAKLLLEPMTTWHPFRKHCPNASCQERHQEGPVYGELAALRPDDLQELVMQVGRFRDRTSAKNRALVSIPPWLFPMPGANALYYVKAVLVHEGRYINGGHYTLFKREGPAEADTAQDAVEDVESEAEGADEADAGHEEGTLGLESMAIDESDEQVAEKLGRSVEDLKKLGMNKRKRQAKDKAHQERIESAASFQLWKKYEDDKLTTRVPWAKIEEQASDWYLILAVPASKADLVSLAQRVESNITHAALDSLSKALREKQPVKQFVRSTLPAITAVLQRHFELLGGDLALFAGPSDEDGSDHESPSQSEADQALLDFGFEAFANLGHGDTLPSSQDPASLRNLIEEEARDRLRDAFEVTADGTGPQTPDERARSILRNIFDTITDAITHAAASYIERQRQLRARGAWDDFCGSRVAAFLQNEEEAAVRRARQKAEEARRAAAERERYDRIKKVDMGDVLAALLYGLTDEETDAILDDLEWHIQEKTKNAHESTPRTRKEGTGSDSREGRNEDRSEAAGDAERVPQKDGSLHNQATASISREGTFGHNLRDPENDITAEEMLIDLASDDGDSFEESEAAMPSLADCSVPRQEALKTSAEKIIQSAQSKATGSSSVGDATMNDMRFVQDIPQRPGLTSPTSASSEGRMAGVSSNQQPPPPTRPGTLPSTPSRFSTTPEHVRAALGPTPQPSQPFNFFPSSSSPSSPLPLRTSTTPEHIRDALGRTPTASPGFGMFSPTTLRPGPVPSASGGSAGNEHETQNRIRAFPPAAGNFNQPHRLPLGAQAHSTVGPIRFHERPSPLSTPYPAGRPFVTESGSPLASGRGRTLRRTPTPFSSKHARRGSTPELLLTGDIGEVASNLEPTQRRDTLAPRLSPQPEEDLLITPTRNASTLTLAHRPTPPRRPHPDAHESRESPYRRDRSIRRGSEGPSQHGDPVSVSHSSQPPSLHSSEHHRTGDVSIGPAQGFVFPADTTGEMGTYPSGHPSESHTIGSGLSRTLSAVRHPRRTLREVRSRHSRATLGADTFVAPVAESRQQAQRSQPHRSRSRGGMHQSQEDVSDSGIDRVRRRASQMLLALSDVASPNTAHDRPRTREGTSDRLRTREDTEDHLSSHEGTHEEEPRGLRRSLSAHNLLARLGRRPTASPRPSPQPDDPVPEGLGSSPPSMGPETAEAGSADIRQPHRPETYRPTGLPEPVARSNDGRLRAPTRQAAPARAQAPSGSSAYDIPLDSDEGIAAAGTTSKSSKAGSKGSKRDNGR